MKTRDLAAEMRAAMAGLTPEREEALYGLKIPWPLIEIFQLVGVARITVAGGHYQPDHEGATAYLTPALVDDPLSPESLLPATYCRLGSIVDIVAWRPKRPGRCWRRTGAAERLGSVPPQYLAPEPVRVWRDPLEWLRADCEGIVPLGDRPSDHYLVLSRFPGGLEVSDAQHAAQLRRVLERTWSAPAVRVAGAGAQGRAHAA